MSAIDISGINQLPAINEKVSANAPINRAEFIAYMAALASDYWDQAEDAEDNDPALCPANDRIGDFILSLQITRNLNND